jgi:hypothetical protein
LPPASPEPVPDARAAIDAVLEPLREETDRVGREMEANRAFLDERRARGIDPGTRALLDRAADSPEAPDSLRRLARQVAAGRVTWDDVFAHRAGPEGEAFLADAFRTARDHFSDTDLTPVIVPDEALEIGVDPAEVSDDLARTLAEAAEEHDAIFRHAFDGTT